MNFSRALRALAVLTLVAAAMKISSRAADTKEAESLYKTKCVTCHAADGSGNTPAGKKLGVRDFRSAEAQKQSDSELSEIVGKGKNKMPGYAKSLKEAQIKDLVAYIRELARKK